MKKARAGAAVLAALALAATAACSGGGSNPGDSGTTPSGATGGETTGSGSPAAEPVEITYWHAYSADSNEIKQLENVVIPGFEAANPGITVNAVAVPYDDLHQKLITAVAGDELPDVVRADIIWVPQLANLGVLEPLDESMPGFGEIAAAVYPGPLATAEWGGSHYGLPLSTNTIVQLYDPAVYAKLGITAATTMDEFKANADAAKAAGIYAYADSNLKGWNLLPWIWSFGGSIVNDDVTEASGYINSPETVAAVQFIYDLYKDGKIPTIITQSGATQTNDGFGKGEYATILGGPWMFPILAGSYPDLDLKTARLPEGPGGSVSVVGGEDVVVTASSEHKDAAFAFTKYLVSDEAQLAMAEVGQLSVLSSLADKMIEINPYYATFVDQLTSARPRPATPAWEEMDSALETRLQAAFLGDGDIKAALDDLAVQFDTLLAEYK
jgi:multiple sugar transport system substrate-binding protein